MKLFVPNIVFQLYFLKIRSLIYIIINDLIFRFLNDRREKVRAENPAMPFAEITKLLASEWSNLPADQKQVYTFLTFPLFDLNSKLKQVVIQVFTQTQNILLMYQLFTAIFGCRGAG